MCVCVYKYGSERACSCVCVCVCACVVCWWLMYRPGGQTLQASLVKNLSVIGREEPKGVQIATLSACVCVCTRVCVCMKCIQPLGYSQKQVRRETCENGGRPWCCVKAHCPPVVFSCFTTADDTDVWCECLEVEADVNTTWSLSRSLVRLEDGKICNMCFLNVKIWHVVNNIEDEDVWIKFFTMCSETVHFRAQTGS